MEFKNLRHRTDGSIEGRYYNEALAGWVAFQAEEGTELWETLHSEADAIAQLKQEQAQPLPAYPTLEEARTAMVHWIGEFLASITGQVPAFERASWPTKAEAARAYVAGTARPDQAAMIAGEAQASGRTEADVAAIIIARADAYQQVIAQAAGLRVSLDTQLEAATDPVQYETILDSGKEQARALAVVLGVSTF